MKVMEIPAARLLRKTRLRHGLTSSFLGLGLFALFGATGLLLDRMSGSGTDHRELPLVGHPGWGVGVTPGEVLAWNAPEPSPRWVGDPSRSWAFGEDLDAAFPVSVKQAPSGTPLVLVADGLAELEAEPAEERSLLLEPDGTLRMESKGTLVGFLHVGRSHREGDSLMGPGPLELRLLHHDSWLADRVRVPVVEPDGEGRWTVKELRTFGVETERESRRAQRGDPGRPKLHPRTGLPWVELVSRME